MLNKENMPKNITDIKDEFVSLVDKFKEYHEALDRQYAAIDALQNEELKLAAIHLHRDATANIKGDVLDKIVDKLTEKIEVAEVKWMNVYLVDDMPSQANNIFSDEKYHHSYILAKNSNELYYINKQGQREKMDVKKEALQSIIAAIATGSKTLTSPIPINEYISDQSMVELDNLIKAKGSVTLMREKELRDHFYNFRVEEIEKVLDQNIDEKSVEFGPVNLNASTRIMYALLNSMLNEKDHAHPQVVFSKSEDDKSILVKYLNNEYNLTTLLRHVDWRHMPRFDESAHQAYMEFLTNDFGHGGSQVKPERPDAPLRGTWKIPSAGKNYQLALPLEDKNTKQLEKTVYVRKHKGDFHYSCLGPDGTPVEGEISKKQLLQYEQDPSKIQAIKELKNPLDQDKLAFLHPYILAETNKRGHTVYSPTPERVANVIANIHDNDRKDHDYLELSDAEVAAINIYTGNSSYLMNKLLRNDTMTYEDEFIAKLHVDYDDFVDINQSRKYFTQGISELLMHVAMASSAANKPKEHNLLEFDTLMISVSSKKDLDETKLTALQKEHGNIPILINENGNISIYGYDGKEWKQSALLDAEVFKAVPFPPVGEIGEILSAKVTDEMKAEMKKGHVNEPQVVVRRLEISAGREWLLEAIQKGVQEQIPQYVPGQTLQSTTIEARSTYANITGNNMVGLLFRNEAPGVRAANASQFQGEGERILGPGITLLYDAIVQEGRSHIVSTRVISTPQGRAEDPYEKILRENPIDFEQRTRADAKSAAKQIEAQAASARPVTPPPVVQAPMRPTTPPPVSVPARPTQALPSQAMANEKLNHFRKITKNVLSTASSGLYKHAEPANEARYHESPSAIDTQNLLENAFTTNQREKAMEKIEEFLNTAQAHEAMTIQTAAKTTQTEIADTKYAVIPMQYGNINSATLISKNESGVKSDVYFYEKKSDKDEANSMRQYERLSIEDRLLKFKSKNDQLSIPSREYMVWAASNVKLYLEKDQDAAKYGLRCNGFTRDQSEALQIYCRSQEPPILCSTSYLFDRRTLDKQVNLYKKLVKSEGEYEAYIKRKSI